jgi:ubiquinone/menaquinone biosynthesis C-methylase UbiE
MTPAEGAAMASLIEQKFGAAAADYAACAIHAAGPSLARLVALAAPRPEWRVLDVATGAGHTALALAPHVARVMATDITEAMLAETRKLAAARGLANVEAARADALALPFERASFELVTCRLAAHHFTDPGAFIAEAWRVLRPGGTIALVDNVSPDGHTDPGAATVSLRETADVYNAFETLRDPGHARCLSIGEWVSLLEAAGFTSVRHERLGQDVAFGPWVERMRCDAQTIGRLQEMLSGEVLRKFLKPRLNDDGLVFTLQEAIIVALKPGRE